MFTVLHDAAHRSISTIGWVNATLGRAAMVFVSPAMAFPAWSFIHLEHHRWANDPVHDPDSFASTATGWQTPLRWLFMDGPYVAFYTRHRKGRPRGEVVETSLFMVFTVGLIVTTALTGTFWLLVLVYLIPERIALFVLAWWFDWLPHHGLTSTQRANRYRATRVRVGMEWLFTPLTLSQNYHLVHHLHPSIPFHRYSATWRRNQEAYLDREVAIATVFGRQLTSGRVPRMERAQPGSVAPRAGAVAEEDLAITSGVSPASGTTRRSAHRRQCRHQLRCPPRASCRVPFPSGPARHGAHRHRWNLGPAQLLDLYAGDRGRTGGTGDRRQAHRRWGVLDVRRQGIEGGRQPRRDDADRKLWQHPRFRR